MNDKKTKRISKFLSYVLRHHPESIGLKLDRNGWANVEELIQKSTVENLVFIKEDLHHIVETNDKRRFSFNEDKTLIRANQGHSIAVDLGYQAIEPPSLLFHGTAARNLPSIFAQGLKRGQRHHVHLTDNFETARNVGLRYGRPVILHVDSGSMAKDNFSFFRSDNGVWLTEHVPPRYLREDV